MIFRVLLQISRYLKGQLSLRDAVLKVYLPFYGMLYLIKFAATATLEQGPIHLKSLSYESLLLFLVVVVVAVTHVVFSAGLWACANNSTHSRGLWKWITKIYVVFVWLRSASVLYLLFSATLV